MGPGGCESLGPRRARDLSTVARRDSGTMTRRALEAGAGMFVGFEAPAQGHPYPRKG